MPPRPVPGDALACERIAFAHARTFAFASRLLPRAKRRAAYAVYAFCRTADDIVDAPPNGHAAPATAAARLAAFRVSVHQAFGERSSDPVLRELVGAATTFAVPRQAIDELLDGVSGDLAAAEHRYDTWRELRAYCEGVAASVGEMCAAVFGVPGTTDDRARAIAHARTLGVAMQLTNILRDVVEDAARGRCYLPREELARFGLTDADILGARMLRVPGPWREFLGFQIARARSLYEEAVVGIPLLARDAQRCAAVCAAGYAEILTAIERQHGAELGTRAVVPTRTLAAIVVRAYLGLPPAFTRHAAARGQARPGGQQA